MTRADTDWAASYVESLDDDELDDVLGDAGDNGERRSAAGHTLVEFSDDAIALLFTQRYGDRLRHTAPWGKWHEWTGTHWREDSTLAVFDRARKICREVAQSANPKIGVLVASARTVASVERLARADRRHAVEPEVWDADPWLLATPGGMVDLKTGDIRPSRPEDYCTRLTAVAPNFATQCSRWLAFLEWASGGDSELQRFLQRVTGYALTGVTIEHALFFLYGVGRNGKSTFLNTIAGVLGDYGRNAPMDAFTESRGERHPTDLAMLRGARLVTAQETESGRQWAESRIKALTGGDPLTARFMRQDFFTFEPQFKLLIAGNNKPTLSNVDEAIRRRFHLLPFEQRIPDDDVDPNLREKLCEEWPAILAWMIEGSVAWQHDGLAPPQRVRQATAAYLSDQDSGEAWLAECCTAGAGQWDTSANLFRSWVIWAQAAGEKPGSAKAFSEMLQKKGFQGARLGHSRNRGFSGLSVRQDTPNAYRED